jgi:hypothetical protein
MRFEIDEEVDVALPPVVDDDGDPCEIASVEFMSSNTEVCEFIESPDNPGTGIARPTGIVGSAQLAIRVTTPDGATADYTGDVTIGLGVPAGGTLSFGEPRKRAQMGPE